jgi:O-antigen ligase
MNTGSASWRRLPRERLLLALIATAVALTLGVTIGVFGATSTAAVIGALVTLELSAVLVAWRQNEVIAVAIIVISLLIDWYQLLPLPVYFPAVATVLALALISIMLLARLPEHPWVPIPLLPLWGLLLIFTAFPIMRSVSTLEGIRYYVTVICNSFLLYIIGLQVARDGAHLRKLLSMVAGFGTLIAIHTIIAAQTGIFLLESSHWNSFLISVSDFTLTGSQDIRAGSFLVNPDLNGAFLALMVFLPAGLLMDATSTLAKILYLAETGLILLALLFTYSTAAWIAVGGGLIAFVLLVRRGRYRFYLLAFIGAAIAGILFVFPTQVQLLTQHSTTPHDFILRVGAWETGIQVIRAHPLTGIGLGYHTYMQRAEPYRVPLQPRPFSHPHNSFLELAAMAGLPALLVFLLIVGSAGWLALRNYRGADRRYRALLGGAITAIVVLSINSLAINGWTAPPLVPAAWLILGAIASPALAQTLRSFETIASTSSKPMPAWQPEMEEVLLTGKVQI